jgi:hypothetical protein
VSRRDPNGADLPVATAVPLVRDATWTAMRVSMVDRWISMELGPTKNELREVIRWQGPNDRVDAGQLGLAIASGGLIFTFPARVEVKNLRVHTRAVIPDGGSTRDAWNFAGVDALHAVKQLGTTAVAACPAYPGACATCVPDAGSACLEMTGNSQASIDVPIGLDYGKPWKVKFKFAADVTGTATNPSILRTTVVGPAPGPFDAFAGFALIDSPGFNWNQPLRAWQDNNQGLGPLDAGVWSSFELLINNNPTDSTYTLHRNGVLVRTDRPPPTLSPHLGALVLGGGGGFHGYFTELEISQEP